MHDSTNVKKILKEIQEYKPEELTFNPATLETSKIMWVTRLLPQSSRIGDAVMKIGDRAGKIDSSVASASMGFHIGSLVVTAIDFISIPLIYLLAFLYKEKVPMTLENNTKWFYSALILSLTLVALFIPPLAALIVALVTGITLVASLFVLGKALYEHTQEKKELEKVEKLIKQTEDRMFLIQGAAINLEWRLKTATSDQTADLLEEFDVLYERNYCPQKAKLQQLKEREYILKQHVDKSDLPLMDKSAGVAFSSLSVIGLLVALYIPPLGVPLLLSIAVLSLTYIVGRITAPSIKAIGTRIVELFSSSLEAEVPEETVSLLSEKDRYVLKSENNVHKKHDEEVLEESRYSPPLFSPLNATVKPADEDSERATVTKH